MFLLEKNNIALMIFRKGCLLYCNVDGDYSDIFFAREGEKKRNSFKFASTYQSDK